MDSYSENSPNAQMPQQPLNSGSSMMDGRGTVGPTTVSGALGQSSAALGLVPPNSQHAQPIASDAVKVIADDSDANSLDEEWIQKARAIVEQTKADPYQQSRQISLVKASFLKTHYNKDIRIAED